MSVTVNSITTVRAAFSGKNGAGSISVPGLKVGDVLIWVLSAAHFSYNLNGFDYSESVVSVDDELQQLTSTDTSAWSFDSIFLRGV